MNVSIIKKPENNINENIKISSSSDIIDLKDVQAIRDAIREHLLFIGLDNRNNIRNITLLGIGSTCSVIIDTKEIVRTALFSGSDKVILVHNHPSNSLEPSKDDLQLTNVTSQILKPFKITLLDHIIVTEKDYISMEKLKKLNKEYVDLDISNMEKGLLIEENRRLEQKIDELERKMQIKSELKVISAECVGGYNDTTVYNATIIYRGSKEIVTLEKSYHDMQKPSDTWEICSKLELTDEEKNIIIETISKNPPSIYIDAAPKIYSQDLNNNIEDYIEDNVEEIITNITDLDNKHSFTVARVMENGKCVELHYNNGEASVEVDVREAVDFWSNITVLDADWFNINLTDDEILAQLNKIYDDYFGEKDMDLDYDY